MKMLLAFLARKVCVVEAINVADGMCDDKINRCVPFRLIANESLVRKD